MKIRNLFVRLNMLIRMMVVTLGLIAGDCIADITAVEHIALARDFQNQGDLRTSVIELKNALQKNPNNLEARYLLGVISLELGEAVAAEKELRRVLKLGMEREAVLLPLAEALQVQGKNQSILDEIDVKPALSTRDQSKLLVYRGDAWQALNQPESAKNEYDRALEIDSQSSLARLGLAVLATVHNDVEKAQRLLDEAFLLDPKEARLWSFQAGLHKVQNKLEEAEFSYGKAIGYRNLNQVDRANRALVRVNLKNFEGAKEDIAILERQVPEFFLTSFARGWLDFNRNAYSEALTAFESSFRLNEKYLPTLYFIGISHLKQSQYLQAAEYLRRFVEASPQSIEGQRALAFTRYHMGDLKSAREGFIKVIGKLPDDALSHELLGVIELGLGDSTKGLEYIQSAASMWHDSAPAHMRLGKGLIDQGFMEQGLKELERANDLDPDLGEAQILLISNYLKFGQYDKALEAAKRLREKHPESTTPLNLMAGAYIGKGEPSKAREELHRAFLLNPDDAKVVIYLAELEIADGNLDEAEVLYRKMLVRQPSHLSVLIKLAALEQKRGNIAAWVTRLLEAIEKHPRALAPRIYLGDYYLQQGQPTRALATIQEVEHIYSESPMLVALVGQAQLYSGASGSAVKAFKKLVELQPQSAQAFFGLATAYADNSQPRQAKEALDKTLSLNPDHVIAQYTKTKILTIEGKHEDADALVKSLRKSFPGHPEIIELEAWMALQRNQPLKALELYEAAEKRFPSNNIWPVKRSQVQWIMGDKTASLTTLEVWLSNHPDDFQVRYMFGNNLLLMNQEERALAVFERLNVEAPDNAFVVNNLAWLIRKKDIDTALLYAEKAHKLAPEWSEAMDTLAMILLEKGRTKRAVSLLKDATQRSPERFDIRYNLAVVLSRNGNKDEARKVLEKIIQSEPPYAEKTAAQTLLDGLDG